MDLLISINNGTYPAGTLLPSLSRLAHEKNVSVSTVRRALSLLNGVGATKSAERIGTRVLPSHEIVKNCDLKNPGVRKRILDMAQSLQFSHLILPGRCRRHHTGPGRGRPADMQTAPDCSKGSQAV
ncbi:MAG: GntR family transcriptional regulator [Enterocloster bolteae]